MTLSERIVKHFTLWLYGGFVYYCIELLWRGFSHPSMFVLGGICFLVIGALNNHLSMRLGFIWKVIVGTVAVVILEFVAGSILNVWLGLGVWDYSDLAFNIMGQVSLLFFFLFMPIVAFGLWLDRFLRWKIYGINQPKIKWK